MFLGVGFISSHTPFAWQGVSVQQELEELSRLGTTHRYLDEKTIEVTFPASGIKRIKTLKQPSEAEIRSWADARGVPILQVDPATIDTNQFSAMYTYWTEVPVSNGVGFPLMVRDVDGNGRPEIYGGYRDFTMWDYLSRIYEVDTAGQAILLYTYNPYQGISWKLLDADRDGLSEILWLNGLFGVRDFEQPTSFSLPIDSNFTFRYNEAGSPGLTGHFISNLDGDSLIDYLYKTAWRDSVDTNLTHIGTAVAEFDQGINNFRRVWQRDHYREDSLLGGESGGYTADDFDMDDLTEFPVGFVNGDVAVYENTGDSAFELVWRDSLPYSNLFYNTSGDVDNDGRAEFFLCATMFNGVWVLAFEADSNNSYSLRFIFHLLTSGTFDEPTLFTTDLLGDGRVELCIQSGTHFLVFKSDADDSYYLWYYRRQLNRASATSFDFNGNGKQSLVLSLLIPDSTFTRHRLAAHIFHPGPVLSVHLPTDELPQGVELYQNYPNPFNPLTAIHFSLPERMSVTLIVYDILGKEVVTLIRGEKEAGEHRVQWEPKAISSGVYLYRLETGERTITRKMIVIR